MTSTTRWMLVGLVGLAVVVGGWFWYQSSGSGSSADQQLKAGYVKGWHYVGDFQDSAVNVTTLHLKDGRYVAYYDSGQPGTGRKKPKRAFSDDGLSWVPDERWDCPDICDFPDDLPSLPHRDHLALNDGRYRTYESSQKDGGVISLISDDGLTWEREAGLRLAIDRSLDIEQGPSALIDWSAIYLPDGRVRAYYQGQRKKQEGLGCGDCYIVLSAISTDDGLTFTREPGIRLDPLALGQTYRYGGYGFADPIVVAMDGGYRLFFGDYAGPIATAFSQNGVDFTFEGPLPHWAGNPNVLSLDDSRLVLWGGHGQGPGSKLCQQAGGCPENYNLEHLMVYEPLPITVTASRFDNQTQTATVQVDGVKGKKVNLSVIDGTGMFCKYDPATQQNIWEPSCYFDPNKYRFEPASGTVPFTATLRRAVDTNPDREHSVLLTGTVDGKQVAAVVRCIGRPPESEFADQYCRETTSTTPSPSVDTTTSAPATTSPGAILTVSFPTKDATIAASTFEVRGTTKANYEVRIYLDSSEAITAATKASGSGRADGAGTFTVKPTSPALTPGTHILRVATLPKGSSTIDPTSITEVIFTAN